MLIYRYTSFYIIIAFAILGLGCGKDETPRFSIPVEAFFEIPAGLNTIETHFIPINGVVNFMQARLAQNNMTVDQVTSVQSGRGQIIALSPNVEYRLFNDITVNAISVTNQSKADEMYYQDFIEFDHDGNLELLSSISELKEIMLNGIFDMEVKVNLRQSSLVTTEHKIVFDLAVFD